MIGITFCFRSETSEGPSFFNFNPYGGVYSKLSNSEMRKVEAMWKELRPPCERVCVFYVDGYYFFVEMEAGPPVVIARAKDCPMPDMDEKAEAFIDRMKAKSSEVEERWRMHPPSMEEEGKATKRELQESGKLEKEKRRKEKEEKRRKEKEEKRRKEKEEKLKLGREAEAKRQLEMVKRREEKEEKLKLRKEDEAKRQLEKEKRREEKEEKLKSRREAEAKRQETRLEQSQGELFALRCREGNTAYAERNWTR